MASASDEPNRDRRGFHVTLSIYFLGTTEETYALAERVRSAVKQLKGVVDVREGVCALPETADLEYRGDELFRDVVQDKEV